MKKTQIKKPLAIALGTAALSLAGMSAAQASPFAASDLAAGYMVAQADKGGEAKCCLLYTSPSPRDS